MTREEAIQVLQTALTSPFIYGEYADAINMAIEALSIDAVEVVRCKDCEYRNKDGECDCNSLYMQMEGDSIGVGFVPEKDFYCKYGERREDDDA